ncbi:MAG: hypothetical protein LBT29_03850 [Flavobacteriaceae bacterium]|jgi:hypothetical protein|nr:hypothetical protein [Flavobacteriaceae bacterium]
MRVIFYFLRVLSVAGFLMLSLTVKAQDSAESKVKVDFSGDFVSSYVWRGFKQTGASIQPALSLTTGGLTVGAWGSTDFEGGSSGHKEVDFYASYAIDRFSVTVTDYWWDGEGAFRYFSNPDEGYSGHMLEASAAYTFSEKFPLSVAWNTFLLGEGNKKVDGGNSFSTFVELSYPFSFQNFDFSLAAGFTPWESAVYGTNGFRFTQINLGVSKKIPITDSFSLPVYGNIIANPATEDIHFVFGIKIE